MVNKNLRGPKSSELPKWALSVFSGWEFSGKSARIAYPVCEGVLRHEKNGAFVLNFRRFPDKEEKRREIK